MEVREQSKIVELWLTREERDDPAFRESLKPIYQQYKDQKYLVAVFLSGEEDLYQQTRDLMVHLEGLLSFLLPLYVEEGKTALVIAVGCTGGHHRSVAVTRALADFIRQKGYNASESHRDMTRD